MMPETSQSKRDGIEKWLTERLGGEVHVGRDKMHRVTWFRIEGLSDVQYDPVLRVHDEALDENELALKTILEDFGQQDLAEELLAHPTIHRTYGKGTARKIPDYETMPIRCDERAYSVRRGEDFNVHILNSQGRRLINPGQPTTRGSSVFLRDEQEWCDEVRRRSEPDPPYSTG